MKYLVMGIVFSVGAVFVFGGDLIVVDETTDQSLGGACAAFDWREGTFLTVWSEKNADNTVGSIVCQRLDEEGGFVGSRITVSSGSSGLRDQTAVAYSSYYKHFLVVYVLNDDSIWGRFCDSSGTMSSLFKIVDVISSDSVSSPSVVYDQVEHYYVVAYTHTGEHTAGTVSSQIFVQRVSYTGTLIGSSVAISDASAGTNAAYPSIATVGLQSLIVWQQQQSAGSSLYNVYGCMFEEGSTGSSVLPIATSLYSSERPDVAADERTRDYLVVFSGREETFGSLYRIYGMRVQSNSARSPAWTVGSDSGYNLKYPAAGYEWDHNRFVVAWSGVQSGAMTYGSKVQYCRTREFGYPDTAVETLYSETSPFSGGGSADVVVSDTDVAMVLYRKNWLVTAPETATRYQVLAWRDEYCIDADINCDGNVNLYDLRILAESWLVGQ